MSVVANAPCRLPSRGGVDEALDEQFVRFLRRRCLEETVQMETTSSQAVPSLQVLTTLDDPEVSKQQHADKTEILPKGSPYVGFKRHAPPSPVLRFTALSDFPPFGAVFSALGGDEPDGECESDIEVDIEQDGSEAISDQFPSELWASIFTFTAEVESICTLSSIARGFPKVVTSPAVWRGRRLHLSPQVLDGFAPVMDAWLTAWSDVTKLLVPNSGQLLEQVQARAPSMNVEVAWRFNAKYCAVGVEVINRGATVQKVDEEELVVLGDAPLNSSQDHLPYMEVRIDRRIAQEEADNDQLNDMGIGFTMCKPKDLRELGSVADEIPCSWVVDFAQSFVLLSVNNVEAARSRSISAASLAQGDRLGLRLNGGAIEVFINGILRESFLLPPRDRVPKGAQLHPVFDLFGLTEQLSVTGAEAPVPHDVSLLNCDQQ